MNEARPGVADAVAPPPAGAAWTVLHLVRWSASYLESKGVEGARLDAEHLLADALGTDRLQLYLDFDRPLSPEELARFRPRLLERARRKPLQYILGRTDFRELTLRTDPRVLIPRSETEELVGVVLAWARTTGRDDLRALDVGTGSGAIALSLAIEGPFAKVVATDSSRDALDVARENAHVHGLSGTVDLRTGALLDPVQAGERFDVVVSNPPYVSADEFEGLAPEVRDWEPREALVAEGDGTSLALELVRDAGRVLEPGGLLALEIGFGQAEVLSEAVRGVPGFAPPDVRRDLAGRDRFLLARWGRGSVEGGGA